MDLHECKLCELQAPNLIKGTLRDLMPQSDILLQSEIQKKSDIVTAHGLSLLLTVCRRCHFDIYLLPIACALSHPKEYTHLTQALIDVPLESQLVLSLGNE